VNGRRLLTIALLAAGCATGPQTITKIVNGRVVSTRAVTPSAYEHVSRALVFEEEERWNDAAAELQRALVYDNDSPELQAHLAEIFMRLERLDDAASAVKASRALAETPDGLIAEAHLRQLRGDPAGAVASLERATSLVNFAEDGAQAESAYLELGDAALVALDSGRARKAYQVLCDSAPESLTGRLRLAAVAWANGDLPEVEKRLKETLVEEPNQLDALLTLGAYYAATGRNAQARASYAEALDRAEGATDVAIAYARFLMTAGDRKQAEQLADDQPPLDPKDNEALGKRLELERVTKRHDRALAMLKTVEQSDASEEIKARLPLLRAQVLADAGKRDQAVSSLLAIGKEATGRLEARLQAAELLREDGKGAEAARALGDGEVEAGEGERADIELAVARGLADERRGDSARAVRHLEEALARHPGSARVLLTLASLEERRGQWKRALELTDGVLAKEPGSVEALNFWGFVAADHSYDLPRALKRLVAAASLDAGTGSIIDSVGWAHLKSGDLARAALFLEQAARLEPADPEVLSHVGALYVRRAEPERAASTFRKALEHKPEDALRRRLEEELSHLESRKAARP
jgi:tetratricopeptide (TPR) repeat protein